MVRCDGSGKAVGLVSKPYPINFAVGICAAPPIAVAMILAAFYYISAMAGYVCAKAANACQKITCLHQHVKVSSNDGIISAPECSVVLPGFIVSTRYTVRRRVARRGYVAEDVR